MLPDKSSISMKHGVWFVHHDGKNSIKIFCSNFGKEEVYLNENLISEQRSLKIPREFSFNDEDGTKYQIKLEAANVLKGMECYVYRGEELIKSFRTKLIRANKNKYSRFIFYLPALLIVLLIDFFNFPIFYNIISFPVVLVMYYIANGVGKLVVEEENNVMS